MLPYPPHPKLAKLVNLAISYILHDAAYYLAESIASFQSAGQVFAFANCTPWHDQSGDFQHAAIVAEQAGDTVVLGDWHSELAQRHASREHLLTGRWRRVKMISSAVS